MGGSDGAERRNDDGEKGFAGWVRGGARRGKEEERRSRRSGWRMKAGVFVQPSGGRMPPVHHAVAVGLLLECTGIWAQFTKLNSRVRPVTCQADHEGCGGTVVAPRAKGV